VNTWFVPTLVVKPSDQSVTSSTTLVNDTALLLPVAANALYTFNLVLLLIANDTAQIKMQFTGPAGATMQSGIMGFNTGATFGATTRAIATPVTFTGNGVAQVPLFWQGTVQTVGTPGTFQFQWAQNTSNGTACTVKVGSSLCLVRAG
jgi:hypothetical protein